MLGSKISTNPVSAAVALLTCLLFLAQSALGVSCASANPSYRVFFVDSESGRDSNDGLSQDHAWRSLDRVNSADLKSGDTVRFKCGCLWRGSLKPVSGSEEAPITYTSYGSGAKPFILGSRPRNRPEDWVQVQDHVISQEHTHHVVYDGLAVKYGAAHGFGGGNTHHLTIRNCDLGYIGGGHQFTNPGGKPVRFGNAIEFWGAASDNLVEGCRIWEVYDAALTNQNKTATVRQENITYRNNIIWNCEYSFEYWNGPETSVTRNIQFINNTCVNAGVVWSHAQRSNPNGSHLMF